ncbi:MAG TPA: hypothetical protein PK993_03875 [Clostridia bacterium]|nr:hypothetical protein [Clostridia bacterium]
MNKKNKIIIQIKQNGELNILKNKPKNQNNCIWQEIKINIHNEIESRKLNEKIRNIIIDKCIYEEIDATENLIKQLIKERKKENENKQKI